MFRRRRPARIARAASAGIFLLRFRVFIPRTAVATRGHVKINIKLTEVCIFLGQRELYFINGA